MDAIAPVRKPALAPPRRLLKFRSDAALAERFASGDEAAFDVLYERNRASVLAVCVGVLGTAHDAEDATQETFTALAVALRKVPPREIRPWLVRVARNAAIDVARRRRGGLTANGEVPEVPAHQSSGAAELRTVLVGIRELPESQRTALLMRELGGHSYLEIAALLEVEEEAVRGLIARARVGLRTYREASEMPCAAARESIEAEPDGRRHDKTVRRHVRGCASCKAYRAALRDDAEALRALMPLPLSGLAGSGAVAGGCAAAKGVLVGAGLAQVTAACAASVCAVGGLVLIDHPPVPFIRGAIVHASGARRAVVTHARSTRTVVAPALSRSTGSVEASAAVTVPATGPVSRGSESTGARQGSTSVTHAGLRRRRSHRLRTTSQFPDAAPGRAPSTRSAPQVAAGGFAVRGPGASDGSRAAAGPARGVGTPTWGLHDGRGDANRSGDDGAGRSGYPDGDGIGSAGAASQGATGSRSSGPSGSWSSSRTVTSRSFGAGSDQDGSMRSGGDGATGSTGPDGYGATDASGSDANSSDAATTGDAGRNRAVRFSMQWRSTSSRRPAMRFPGAGRTY